MTDFSDTTQERFKLKWIILDFVNGFLNERENENPMHRIIPRGKIRCRNHDMWLLRETFIRKRDLKQFTSILKRLKVRDNVIK